jgi:two-component system chemotaxis response regulator CheB
MAATSSPSRKIRTLIVDDSAMVRKILSMGLGQDPEIEVIGAAPDPRVAMQYMVKDQPDVITLDLEMPNMDGLTFLRGLMAKKPVPTVVISSQTQRSAQATVDALAAGAVDVIAKPKMELGGGLNEMMTTIADRVKVAARATVAPRAPTGARAKPVAPTEDGVTRPRTAQRPAAAVPIAGQGARPGDVPDWMIAIGASTGGVQALTAVLQALPANMPPIVIVQHMPEGFTASFAKRLDQTCALNVREAKAGDLLENGQVLIAPGGPCHMQIQPKGDRFEVELIEGPEVCFSRPAVDVLFKSVARHAKGRVSSAILTGMGRDGAEGQLAIRLSGGRCVAQDEASCVVFGMPQAARDIGAAHKLLPLSEISSWLTSSVPVAAAREGRQSYRV